MRSRGLKECAKCGDVKDIGNFNRSNHSEDGYQSYCRRCNSSYHKEWRDKISGKQKRSRNRGEPPSYR